VFHLSALTISASSRDGRGETIVERVLQKNDLIRIPPMLGSVRSWIAFRVIISSADFGLMQDQHFGFKQTKVTFLAWSRNRMIPLFHYSIDRHRCYSFNSRSQAKAERITGPKDMSEGIFQMRDSAIANRRQRDAVDRHYSELPRPSRARVVDQWSLSVVHKAESIVE